MTMLHANVAPRTLGFVRAWVFGIWLVIVLTDRFGQLAALPPALFEPYGVLHVIPGVVWSLILTSTGLLLLKLALVGLIVLTMVGARPYRPIALSAVALIVVHQGLVRGFGFINHAELAALYAAAVLALFPAADGFALSPRKEPSAPPATYSLAMVLATLLPLLAYSAIALYRVAKAAPDIFFSDTMLHYIGRSTFRSSYFGMGWGRFVLEHVAWAGPLINAGYFVVTLFEIASPFCLFSKRLRVAWLCVIVPFHVSTLFLMNIFFWENLLLFCVTMTDIDRIVARWPSRRRAAVAT